MTARGEPVVVIVDQFCADLHAFRFAPTSLTEIWSKELNDDKSLLLHSSPAVLDNGNMITVGRIDGKAVGYDLDTGNELWEYDAKEPIMATPASPGGLVYAVSLNHVQAIDPVNGDANFVSGLGAEPVSEAVASPALSADIVYVSTSQEFRSYSLDFNIVGHDVDGRGGLSSPAIGNDGTVYTISTNGETAFLHAYPGARR